MYIKLSDKKKISKKIVKQITSIVEQARKEILSYLSQIPAEKYDAFWYGKTQEYLKTYIERLRNMLESQFKLSAKKYGEELSNAYNEIIDEKLADLGILTSAISPEYLTYATQISGEFIKRIPDDIREEVEKQLRISALAGDDIHTVTKKLTGKLEGHKDVFKTVEKRAETIARTEILRMQSQVSWAHIQELGQKFPHLIKIWRTSKDARVRDDHVTMEGVRVQWDKPFMVGGFPMMYPRDPQGPAKEVINCRCYLDIEIPDEDIKAYLKGQISKEKQKKSMRKPVKIKTTEGQLLNKWLTELKITPEEISDIVYEEFKDVDLAVYKGRPTDSQKVEQHYKVIEEKVHAIFEKLKKKIPDLSWEVYQDTMGCWATWATFEEAGYLHAYFIEKTGFSIKKFDKVSSLLQTNEKFVGYFISKGHGKEIAEYLIKKKYVDNMPTFKQWFKAIDSELIKQIDTTIPVMAKVNQEILSKVFRIKEISAYRFVVDCGFEDKLTDMLVKTSAVRKNKDIFLRGVSDEQSIKIMNKIMEEAMQEISKKKGNEELTTNLNPLSSWSSPPESSNANFGAIPLYIEVPIDKVFTSYLVDSHLNNFSVIGQNEFVIYNAGMKYSITVKSFIKSISKLPVSLRRVTMAFINSKVMTKLSRGG